MSDWKVSLFNNYTQYQDKRIIFNSLTKQLAETKNEKIYSDLCNGKVPNCCEENFKTLIKLGFIIKENVDEVKVADMQNFDDMYSKILRLVIMPTEECNFRCKYCYESFNKGIISQENQRNLLLWLRKNIHKYERVEVGWFGGEPLLAHNVISELSEEMIRICHKAGIAYSASITTNGYLLTPEMMRNMIKARILTYQITIDGIEEQHNQFRQLKSGDGTFQIIVDNLKAIKKEIKTKVFNINIRHNISKSNISNIYDFLKFFENEFGNDNRFALYFRPVGDWGGSRVKEIQNDLTNDINQIYQTIIDTGLKINYLPYIDFIRDGMCNAGKRNSFVIRASGRINKCTMLLEHELNDVGEITSTGEMILDYNKIAKWHHFQVSDGCKECAKRPSCNERTCPAKHFLLDERGKCGYENTYMHYVLQLLSNSELIQRI